MCALGLWFWLVAPLCPSDVSPTSGRNPADRTPSPAVVGCLGEWWFFGVSPSLCEGGASLSFAAPPRAVHERPLRGCLSLSSPEGGGGG